MTIVRTIRVSTICSMMGLLPLITSQAQAQNSSRTTMLSSNVVYLAMNTTNDSTSSDNTNEFLFPDAYLMETDAMSAPGAISHGTSSSAWLLGGSLSAGAGLLGLLSGGGSPSLQTRTPASPSSFLPSIAINGVFQAPVATFTTPVVIVNANSSTANGSTANSVSGGNSGFTTPGGSTGTIGGLAAFTPEPGSIALLTGLGLGLTSITLRRRKRQA